ncbi:uncharacterized protein cd79b isoform X1 [Sander lucioperca]|uniref:uncharacterized protein cd79b isoform X1 n=1 Tax=Sander lucioperca TaxID=283035 RepID=UPI00125E8615|nr:uncharacterized protein cd79b isoform X1 [Sander lucioperca]XP_035853367.1 uncharacterized protein cd79b isoform X1 [Sander lucioperca]
MRWLLAGCCGLALINISVAMLITQKPRFYGVKPKRNVGIYCLFSKKIPQATVQWYKADKYNSQKKKIEAGEQFVFHSSNLTQNILLFIHRLQINDAGVYFCKLNNTWGPGTAVQVGKPLDVTKALYRTKMKDALIILQGLVLAVFIAALLLHKRHLQLEKTDIIYEEPETDHIYEGLAIETCGGDLYEDLCVYAQPEDAEAPWE